MVSTRDLRELAEMLEEPSLDEMFLLLDQQPRVARVNLLEDDLAELTGSARRLRGFLQRKAKLEDFFQLTPYEPGYPNEENQLVHLDPKKFPEFSDLMAAISGRRPPELGSFELNWRNVDVEVRTFRLGQELLAIVRHVPRANILTPNGPKKFFALSRSGILQMQSREGISFDNTVDAFLWRGALYMVNVGSIENTFRLKAVLEANAEEVVDAIQKAVQIPGLERIVDLAKGNLPLLRKLRRISQQDYLAQLKVPLLERVAKTNKLDIKFEGSGADRRLAFDASNRNDVLKLLDDDYLLSELTQRRYSVRDQAKKALS